MSVDISSLFDEFIEAIELGEPQLSRMDSAAQTVSAFIAEKYEVPASSVFLQGSYANGTAVEPVDGGEYDIDIVGVCIGPNVSCNSALNDLESKFKADGRFAERVKRKKPCIRLEYAEDNVGSFHVDVVPVRKALAGSQAPLQSPRRDEDWRDTAPLEYRDWCLNHGEQFRRTVMAMKRWRDFQQPVRQAIRSIVLQVLVSQNIASESDDATRLARTLKSLYDNLSGLSVSPPVYNPVLPSEDLAKSWTAESFRSFVNELDEAVKLVKRAQEATDEVEAADAWRELLGDDFPTYDSERLGLSVEDYSHAESPAAKGWSVALDPSYRISLSARAQSSRGGIRATDLSSNEVLLAGRNIQFKVTGVVAPRHVEIWWQVANTGQHATSDNGKRGEIFKGKDLQSKLVNEYENWESTRYHGSHLIRVMMVRETVVVAQSNWFSVNIWAARTWQGYRRR